MQTIVKATIKMIALLVLFSLPLLSLAQGGVPEDPVDTPIDGGLSVLLAAGAAYGVKRMRKGAKPPTPDGE